MQYVNPNTGQRIELGDVNGRRRRVYEIAAVKFVGNANWFAFEKFVCEHFTFPDMSIGAADPVFLALADMWLQLGINQGFGLARDFARSQTVPRASGVRRPARLDQINRARHRRAACRHGR